MAKERGKIRGFFFEIDGGEETLQEGLKNFGAALGRALSGPHRPPKPALPAPSGRRQESETNGEELDGEENTVDGDIDGLEDTTSKPAKKTGRKAGSTPKVIELDLEGKDISFKEFAAQKKPENFTDRFLCVAAWFKDHGGVDEISVNHVFTCYKIVGWTPHPSSYHTVLNDLKNKQQAMAKGSGAGAYKINLHGENMVAEMGAKE